MKIIKRDGRIVEYNRKKIENAIMHANNDVAENNRANKRQIDNIIKHIEELNKKRMLVEDIQDMIETELMKIKKYDLAKAYIIYRYKRALVRKSNITDESILSLIKNSSYEKEDNYKNNLVSMQRDLIASEVSKDLTKRVLLPEKISEAHNEGLLYFNNDNYFLQPLINSCIVNYDQLLNDDFLINNVTLNKPTDFVEACNILSQIILNLSVSQYGYQAIDIHYLSKYLKKTEEKFKNNKDLDDIIKTQLSNGIKILLYQINSLGLLKENGIKVTLFLSLINDDNYSFTKIIVKEILEQYTILFKREKNYPNLIYLLDENNTQKDNDSFQITKYIINMINEQIPITLVSKRLMLETQNNNIFSPMGLCHLLPPYKDKNDKYKYLGRFNQGIVTLNLPQIGLASNSDEKTFWFLLEERLDLCKEALMCRYHNLLGTTTTSSPLHYQMGAIATLGNNETIDLLLKNGYSTLTLGYLGLEELVQIIKKASILEKNGTKFAIKVLKYMREKCDLWKKECGLSFVLHGIIDKDIRRNLLKIDKEKFGSLENINDKDCYNASHNVINNNQDIYTTIKVFNNFQSICNGGDISFIETEKIIDYDLIKYIYDNIHIVQINKKEGNINYENK